MTKETSSSNRWAVLIGINGYHESLGPLKYSVNDCRRLAEVLTTTYSFWPTTKPPNADPPDMYGMDRTLIRIVVKEYATMGVVMLFGMTGLLLTAWIGLVVKNRKHLRSSECDNEKEMPND